MSYKDIEALALDLKINAQGMNSYEIEARAKEIVELCRRAEPLPKLTPTYPTSDLNDERQRGSFKVVPPGCHIWVPDSDPSSEKTGPLLCVNCKWFDKKNEECVSPSNDPDLVYGHPKRVDAVYARSQAGDDDNYCGPDGDFWDSADE